MARQFKYICILLAACFLLIGRSATAHEYWLESDLGRVAVGAETPIRLMFGKEFRAGEEKPLQLPRTSSFLLFGQARKPLNLLAAAKADQEPAATIYAKKEGAMLVAMERSTANIGFSRAKFVSYAQSEGHILAAGELPESVKTVHEHYTRYLKNIVRVGEKLNTAPMKIVGLRYEIVPVGNPFSKGSGKLTFKVLFDGQPLADATVSAVHRQAAELTIAKAITNEAGNCTLPVTADGHWLIRSVRIEKTAKSTETSADYQSFWASLTFSYE